MKYIIRILFFLLMIKPLLAIVLGLNVFGRKNISGCGQFILVANHNSHLDACSLMNLFPLHRLHNIHPVAAGDYFLSNPILAWVSTTLLNIIPIPRDNITKTNNPITKMGEALDQGKSLILFPEGSRGQPEVMSEFKTGIAHLIKKYPTIPVIPVFLKGMGKSLPKGEAILVPFFCDAVIGEPKHYSGNKDEIVGQIQHDIELLAHILQQATEAES
jgi:1-acyl-sn-glycerol-3-phosphate acyltransferase